MASPPSAPVPTVASPASSLPSSSPRAYPRIDVHTHILPEHLPDLAARYGYGEWVRLERVADCDCRARMYRGNSFFREVEDNCYRPEPRMRDCDASDVDVQVLSTVPVMFSYWAKAEDALDLSIFLNDHIHSVVQQHPSRFLGLCTIPMQSPALAVAELRRCMALGFAGVQIGSHVNDLPLSDPSLFPIFEAAEELGAAVFVHPWDMAGGSLMSKYWLPWLVGMPSETAFAICSFIFGAIFRRLPRLRVAFGHRIAHTTAAAAETAAHDTMAAAAHASLTDLVHFTSLLCCVRLGCVGAQPTVVAASPALSGVSSTAFYVGRIWWRWTTPSTRARTADTSTSTHSHTTSRR